ncbi:MAG TPA: cytochrome P450 [Xanthobacteraceae bacterium]
MSPAPIQPVHLSGPAAMRVGWRLLRDPVTAMRASHAEYGPLIVVSDLLPLTSKLKIATFGVPLILAAGAEFNNEVLSNPAVWRPVSIFPGGPKNSAARRLGAGLARMNGPRHAHYRRLMLPPLRKNSVEALGERMAALAEEEIAAWPSGETIDLWERVCRLMHTFAIGLLFGDDRARGYPIADMVSHLFALKWSPAVRACPINLSLTPYGQFLREGETLERCILDWVGQKRGKLDGGDLLSIMINNPEEDGTAARDTTLVGLMPQLFGAVFETCQNALIWTLFLLAQHPQIARDLLGELNSALADAPPSLQRIADLPWLDAVIKESMRLLPPAPMQARVAQADTSIAGHPVPKGTRIMLSAFVTNRLPGRYPEPDSFSPQRWASLNPSPFEYLVFSAGPRNCPGYLLGMAMVKVALATILRRHRIAFAPPPERVDYIARPGLRPRGQVRATLYPQDGAFSASRIDGNILDLLN